MADRKFMGLWDSVWQFIGELLGAVSLFVILGAGLWAAHIFG